MKHLTIALVSLFSLVGARAFADDPHGDHGDRRSDRKGDRRDDRSRRNARYAAPPAQGPEPVRVEAPDRRTERHERRERQHVDERSQWRGHNTGRADVRYRLDRPWVTGRYTAGFGSAHVHGIDGWNLGQRRFWFGGNNFIVAISDWRVAHDWDWRGDQVVLYEDGDHDGWYLAYNVRLGSYVHVQYSISPR